MPKRKVGKSEADRKAELDRELSRSVDDLVRTTVRMPRALRRAARIAALENDLDLGDLITAGLESEIARLQARKEVK